MYETGEGVPADLERAAHWRATVRASDDPILAISGSADV
jgi:TPR repeat protein